MDTPFTAAPHADVLAVLVQIAVLLLTARLLGELAQRLKQPAVIGELLAGVLVGPSVLGAIAPSVGAWVVPQNPTQGHILEIFALIGAMLLLLVTGLETDLGLIRRRARVAIGVSLGGVIVTLSTGFLLGWNLPADLHGPAASRLVFAAFVATAMSISAIPVIAKVLIDLGMIRRDVGQTIVAAGMSDDTIGWILLSIVTAVAAGESVTAWSVATTVGMVLVFLVGSLTIARPVVERLVGFVAERGIGHNRVLALVLVLAFTWGAITQALHLEAVLGVFVIGVVLGQVRRMPVEVVHTLERVGIGVFAPIFFSVAGLKVDVGSLLSPRLLLVGAVVIAIASVGKLVGTYLGARLIGRRPHWTALAFGAGLNARGAMEILIATIGLRLGILGTEMFSVIVVMAIATSLMAPPALRFVLARLEPDAAEKERLTREELRKASRLGGIRRVLVPLRARADGGATKQGVESFVLDQLDHDLAITLMSVAAPAERTAAQEFLAASRRHFPHTDVTTRVVVGSDPAEQILAEAGRGYDLLVVGAPERQAGGEVVFNRVIDKVVRGAPCPTMVISGQHYAGHLPLRRILVPSGGSAAARTAAELAFMVARGTEAEVSVLHVCEGLDGYVAGDESRLRDRQVNAAHEGIASLEALGRTYGVNVDASVRFAESVEAEVLRRIERDGVDLLILGTDVMSGTSRLYLGARVERILTEATCPVLVLNA